MKKAYYLSTCTTCKRILKELKLPSNFELQDIKKDKITREQLEKMKKLSGSYGSLFNKRARNYKLMNLAKKKLSEEDYKNLILNDYTFLKRPVFIIDNNIFAGNSPSTIKALKDFLNKL